MISRRAAKPRLPSLRSARPTGLSSRSAPFSTTAAATDDTQHSQQHALYPRLFTPLKLKNGIILPNRALMGSMHTGLEGHSIPNWFQRYALGHKEAHAHTLENMAQYFKERAEGGVGCMVTGGIAPNRQGWTGPFAAKLSTFDEMSQHEVVTEAVHSVSHTLADETTVKSRIIMQILHTGRYAYHPMAVSATTQKSPITPFTAKGLSKSGIASTLKDFIQCAEFAKMAGYDGVEVMGSEGYLLSQFMATRTNNRDDEYGGAPLENRARLALEIVDGIRKACGDDFIIVFRLSLLDLVEGGLEWNECLILAKELEAAGVDVLNTGIGWHEARVPTIATSVPRGAFTAPTVALKKEGVVDIPIVATNRINTPQVAESVLEQGVDMVSMARPLLADPNFMNKAFSERADEINTCIACNQACLDHAFVGKTASCLVNPRAGHELVLATPKKLPIEQRKTINIVGAGPAGCSFALTAAQMGHDVTLYDSSDKIGGQFHMAKRVPGKEEFYETLRYFSVMLKKEGVTLKMNTKVSVSDMEASSDDTKWIVATGVTPRDPGIPGQDHANVLSYIDVLKHDAQVGKKVAIIGAGGIGFDVAEFLLHHDGKTDKQAADLNTDDFHNEWGVDLSNATRGGLKARHEHAPQRDLTLLQRKKGKLGKNLGRTTGWIHRATLKMGDVEMIDGASYDKIDKDGNLHITKDGKTQVLEVDNVVVCAGQVVFNELEELTKGTSLQDRVYTIGGAFEAGELDAKRAIDMATRLAMVIHKDDVVPGAHKFQSAVGAEQKMFDFLKKWT